MTIAAGLVCSDGVVLCADTLLSANYRQQGPKAWLVWSDAQVAVAVTGAGNYVLLKLAREAIERRVKQLRANPRIILKAESVKHDVIEPVIASIHGDHVDKANDWDRANGYGLSLLVAVREKGKATLYETDRRACSEVQAFACVGSGAPVGNYVASTTFSPALSSGWAEISAAYVIQQAKAYGDDCGGNTSIIVVPNDGDVRHLSPGRIREREQAGVSIHEAVGRVLMANAAGSDDDDVKTFSELRDVVFEVGNRMAMERGGKLRQTEHTFIHFKRQLPDPEDQPAPTPPKRGRKRRPPSQG